MRKVLLFEGTPYAIYSYGVLVVLAVVCALAFFIWRGKRRGYDGGYLMDVAAFAILGGLIGARIAYVLQNWDYFGDSLLDIVNFRKGGLSLLGVIVGGMLGYVWGCRRRQLPVLKLMDVGVPALLLGQAVGRLGCFLNGCCYGKAAGPEVGWALPLDGVPRYPVQLVELVLDLAVMGTLILWERRIERPGELVPLYIALYAMVRFATEYFRDTEVYALGWTLAQIASLAMIAVAVLWWFMLPKAQEAEAAV